MSAASKKRIRPSAPKVSLQVYATAALYKRVRAAATREGSSVSAWVTGALEQRLESQQGATK